MYGINSCGDFFMKTQKQNRKKRNKKEKMADLYSINRVIKCVYIYLFCLLKNAFLYHIYIEFSYCDGR